MTLQSLSPYDGLDISEFAPAAVNYYYENFLFYEPHEKQRLFHEAGLTAKERLFLAGNRTGKTYGVCAEISMHVTGNYPEWWKGYRYIDPVDVWVASISREATRDILQKQYYLGDNRTGSKGLISNSLIVDDIKGAGVAGFIDTVWVRHKSGGVSTVSFKSYDQGSEKFQGTAKHLIHLDEEPPRDVYIECLTRTASTTPGFRGMVLLSMTPLKGLTRMVLHFTDKIENEEQKKRTEGIVENSKFYIMASWEDNPHLSQEEQSTLKASYLPHEIEARVKGIPSLGSGMVYPICESSIICDPFEIPDYWPRVYGLDFGWTDPTAALFIAKDPENKIYYCYAEYSVPELTPQHHANKLIKMGADWMWGVYDYSGNAKSSNDGRKLTDLYREAGIKKLSAADKSKDVGVFKVLQMMQNGELKIFNNLHKTLSEFRMYARNEKGVICDGNDHLMDCLRYVVMSGLSLAQPKNLSKWKIPEFNNGFDQNTGRWMRV